MVHWNLYITMLISKMTNCCLRNFSFLHLAVFILCFSGCFCENYNNTEEYGKPVILYRDPHNDEIVFRIVKGTPAKLGEIPYQVAFRSRVGRRYYTFCGGSIISEKKLISAAHCFHKKQSFDCLSKGRAPRRHLSNFFAIAGTLLNRDNYYRQDSVEHGQWRRLSAAFYPKHYHFPTHDIAVVFVTRPFRFNQYVAPIPIASVRKEYDGSCLASGYGRLSKYRDSPVLNWANLEIITTTMCNKIHRRNMRHFVCTSNVVSDVYKGDSGGPLVCKNTGDPREGSRGVLVGLTSGGKDYPRDSTFFTRISSYNTFIRSKTSSCNRLQISNWLLLLIKCVFLLF